MTIEERKDAARKTEIDKLMILPKNYSSLLVIAQPTDPNGDPVIIRKIGDDTRDFLSLLASALYEDRRTLHLMIEAIKTVFEVSEKEKRVEEAKTDL